MAAISGGQQALQQQQSQILEAQSRERIFDPEQQRILLLLKALHH